MAFTNLAQATSEDQAAITYLTTSNITLTEQVVLHTNHVSTKYADNVALQTAIKNLQGEFNNFKAEVEHLNKSGHYGSAGAANKYNGRMTPRWKREVQAHHPTWWSTTY